MNIRLLALASAIALTACSGVTAKTADSVKPVLTPAPVISPNLSPAQASLSDEAKGALSKADAEIKKAKADFSVWTTTDKAYKAAQDAAKKGDSVAVIENCKVVMEHIALAMAQRFYPSTELK